MSTVVRRATLADIPAIIDLSVESVLRDPLPVVIDRDAMRQMANQVIPSQAHFCWVTEVDGKVQACVAAMVQPGFWFKRVQASVLLYYSRERGAGLPLLREFARWVKSRPGIKIAVFELEPGCDPRLVRALHRLGFSRASMNVSYVRSA